MGSEWSGRRDFDAAVVEAAIAGALFEEDQGTLWHGGHRTKVDVVGGGRTVDAKTGFYHFVRTEQGAKTDSLGFMGSSRDREMRAGVSDYGLGVVRSSDGQVDVDGDEVTIRISYCVERYLVPASVIDGRFSRAFRLDGEQGKGLNLYLPVDAAQQFRVV